MKPNPLFHRLQMITGQSAMERLQSTRVIIFGVGGVGSWCAEALARSGVGSITLVDSDLICITNVNRQVQATSDSVAKVKVLELQRRLLAINPAADVIALQKIYHRTTAHEFDLKNYDYVIDAIDSLGSKVELIANTLAAGTTLFCALGASCKMDATRIKVDSIWNSHGCHLGRFVRKKLRSKKKVTQDFLCVYSDELLPQFPCEVGCGSGTCLCPHESTEESGEGEAHEWCSAKKQINGSAVHITGTFGFMLAGLVLQDVMKRG